MAKYDPLQRFLRRRRQPDDVTLRFDEIERIIGAILPKAATRSDWWANTLEPGVGVQRHAWIDAGYQARLGRNETVTFCLMRCSDLRSSPALTATEHR